MTLQPQIVATAFAFVTFEGRKNNIIVWLNGSIQRRKKKPSEKIGGAVPYDLLIPEFTTENDYHRLTERLRAICSIRPGGFLFSLCPAIIIQKYKLNYKSRMSHEN